MIGRKIKEMNWIDQDRKKRENGASLKYGLIHPQTDPQCFRREMIEELLDALNYAQWAHEKREITFDQHLGIQQRLRWVILSLVPCFKKD